MLDVAALYAQHGPMVLRRARRILCDDEASRDLAHDVFLTLHEQRATLDDRGLISWLYVVTTRRALKLLRKHTTRARLDAWVVKASVLENVSPHLDDAMMIHQALARLPDELATLAIFRYVDDMTHAEIAEVMGCSRRQIGNLLERLEKTLATLNGSRESR